MSDRKQLEISLKKLIENNDTQARAQDKVEAEAEAHLKEVEIEDAIAKLELDEAQLAEASALVEAEAEKKLKQIITPIGLAIDQVDKKQVYVYQSALLLRIAQRGLWQTELKVSRNCDRKSYTFTTDSPYFKHQVSATLRGEFIAVSPDSSVFAIAISEYAKLAEFDTKVAEAINRALFKKYGEASTRSLFGVAVHLEAKLLKQLEQIDFTIGENFESYINKLDNWALGYLILTNILFYLIEHAATIPNAAAIIAAITLFLSFINGNSYPLNKQLYVLGPASAAGKYWNVVTVYWSITL